MPVEIKRLEHLEEVGNCRFYEKMYPDLDDLVQVRVTNISETAAYVTLLEYNGIEGMVPLSELSRRRIRSVNKHIRVGKTEIVQVIRVDSEKGYIDLSKRKVAQEDRRPCENRYNKAKDVHSIMKHVAEECKVKLESLYAAVAWPLFTKHGHAYDAFNAAVNNPDKIFGPLELPEDIREKLTYAVQHRHKTQPFRIRADVEVTCFTYEGIDAIRDGLLKSMEQCKCEEVQLSIKLLAAPAYALTSMAVDKELGLEVLEKLVEAVKANMTAAGGNVKVEKAPRIVSDTKDEKVQSDSDSEDSVTTEDEDEEEEGEEEEEDEDEE